MSAAAGCGGRGARAVLVLALVACVLVPPPAGGQADGRAATGDQWSQPATDWDLVDDALTVAEGSVAALGQRIEHLYEDIYIGLVMVVDQLRLEIRRLQPALEDALRATQKSVSRKKPSFAKAASMLNRTRELFKLALDIYQRGAPAFLGRRSTESAAVLVPLIRLGNWAFDFPPSRLSVALMEGPVPSSRFLEDFSDLCIKELATPRVPEECNISTRCANKMTDPFMDGYWLTHEIFYVLIAYVSPCRHEIERRLSANGHGDIRTFLRRTCTNIFRDAIFESRQGIPETSQDLFIEQVGFCGLAGFPEFYRPEWIRAIRSWQRPDGCFTDSAFQDDFPEPSTTFKRKPGRTKREELILKDRCRPHKTILGAISMATGLKYLINANNLTATA